MSKHNTKRRQARNNPKKGRLFTYPGLIFISIIAGGWYIYSANAALESGSIFHD